MEEFWERVAVQIAADAVKQHRRLSKRLFAWQAATLLVVAYAGILMLARCLA